MPDLQPEELETIPELADERVDRQAVSTVVLGGRRLPVWAVLIAIVVLTGGGFLVGRGTSEPSSSSTTTTATTSIAQLVEVANGSLVLGRGDAAAEWSFAVFDPTGRSLSVSVDDLSPPDTDLAIAARVTDGRSVNLGRTTGEACDRGTVHATCKLGPAGLEGTRAGTWILRIGEELPGGCACFRDDPPQQVRRAGGRRAPIDRRSGLAATKRQPVLNTLRIDRF